MKSPQTAVHLAENRRKCPDVGEVDCTLSKVGCTCSRADLCRGCVSGRGLGRTSKLRDNTGHRALSCPAGVDSPPSGPAESSRLRRVALRGYSHCRHDADDGQVFRGDPRAVGWHRRHAYWSVSSGFVNERTWAASGSISGAFMGFFEADSRAVTERARDRRRFSIEETALL